MKWDGAKPYFISPTPHSLTKDSTTATSRRWTANDNTDSTFDLTWRIANWTGLNAPTKYRIPLFPFIPLLNTNFPLPPDLGLRIEFKLQKNMKLLFESTADMNPVTTDALAKYTLNSRPKARMECVELRTLFRDYLNKRMIEAGVCRLNAYFTPDTIKEEITMGKTEYELRLDWSLLQRDKLRFALVDGDSYLHSTFADTYNYNVFLSLVEKIKITGLPTSTHNYEISYDLTDADDKEAFYRQYIADQTNSYTNAPPLANASSLMIHNLPKKANYFAGFREGVVDITPEQNLTNVPSAPYHIYKPVINIKFKAALLRNYYLLVTSDVRSQYIYGVGVTGQPDKKFIRYQPTLMDDSSSAVAAAA